MKKNEKNELPILDQLPSVKNSQQQYCRRSKRIAKMVKNKMSATSPSGNAIVDFKSTDATVGTGIANVSFVGNETSGGNGGTVESKAPACMNQPVPSTPPLLLVLLLLLILQQMRPVMMVMLRLPVINR